MTTPFAENTDLVEVDAHSLDDNFFKIIEKDWFLVTAGDKDNYNTMTANWGGVGYLWHKKVCFIFVRPVRYTYQFTESSDLFTLSFFDDKFRKQLDYCGVKSGREVDKVKECGFTPYEIDGGGITFNEARLVIKCRKIYRQDIDPGGFMDELIAKNYPQKDYHTLYIGEIVKVLKK